MVRFSIYVFVYIYIYIYIYLFIYIYMDVYDKWPLNINQRMRSCTRVAKVRWPPRAHLIKI